MPSSLRSERSAATATDMLDAYLETSLTQLPQHAQADIHPRASSLDEDEPRRQLPQATDYASQARQQHGFFSTAGLLKSRGTGGLDASFSAYSTGKGSPARLTGASGAPLAGRDFGSTLQRAHTRTSLAMSRSSVDTLDQLSAVLDKYATASSLHRSKAQRQRSPESVRLVSDSLQELQELKSKYSRPSSSRGPPAARTAPLLPSNTYSYSYSDLRSLSPSRFSSSALAARGHKGYTSPPRHHHVSSDKYQFSAHKYKPYSSRASDAGPSRDVLDGPLPDRPYTAASAPPSWRSYLSSGKATPAAHALPHSAQPRSYAGNVSMPASPAPRSWAPSQAPASSLLYRPSDPAAPHSSKYAGYGSYSRAATAPSTPSHTRGQVHSVYTARPATAGAAGVRQWQAAAGRPAGAPGAYSLAGRGPSSVSTLPQLGWRSHASAPSSPQQQQQQQQPGRGEPGGSSDSPLTQLLLKYVAGRYQCKAEDDSSDDDDDSSSEGGRSRHSGSSDDDG